MIVEVVVIASSNDRMNTIKLPSCLSFTFIEILEVKINNDRVNTIKLPSCQAAKLSKLYLH